jgi:predicted phosphodiesterase
LLPDRFAAIADVHGNTWALDAVLSDIRARSIDFIVNLGDSVYSTLDPAGSAARLIDACDVSICGNEDRVLWDASDAVRQGETFQFVTAELSSDQLQWLQSLSPTYADADVLLCHGTPTSDTTYLLETVTEHGVFLSDTAAIAARLGDTSASLILCGHSHISRVVWLADGRLIVNPGSVGIPAYDDDHPYPHSMESGSPHARYAILTRTPEGWNVEQIAVIYPWDRAADVARRLNRPDRAFWIETGRVKQ